MSTLTDGAGFAWTTSSYDVYTSKTGFSNTYDTGLELWHDASGSMTSFYTGSAPTTEDGGREDVYGPVVSGGISVVRKQYVPADQPFMRLLEVFTNTSLSSKTFTVKISSNIYSDSATTVTATSSGDSAVSAADQWVVVDNSGGSYEIPGAAHVFTGTGGAVQPSAVSFNVDVIEYTFSLTLAPGETKIIMHFASLADTAASAAANAALLADLPSYALTGMSADELSQVANFSAGFITSDVSYTLQAGEENLQLTGTANINGTGNELDNILAGNSGRNVLDGKGGADTMRGGGGNDTYVVNSGGDVVVEDPNKGTDLVKSSISYSLTANVENLTLLGTSTISGTGNSLANRIVGNSAANVLTGGAGDDTYVVAGADTIVENAGEGTDTVQTGRNNYVLPANVENLLLTGSSALNATGNALANRMTGNTGINALTGGAGDDTYVIQNAGDTVIEGAGAGIDTIESRVTYSLPANVENLALLGTGNLNATGNGLNNVLFSNAGNNTLNGGAGTDTASFAGAASAVTASLISNSSTGHGSDTLVSIENLTGGTGNDTLTGNASANVLDGGAGADSMTGGGGNDAYHVDVLADKAIESSGAGRDTVVSAITWTLGSYLENLTLGGDAAINGTGNAAANLLVGNAAENTLNGLGGTDTMKGGGGDDIYVVGGPDVVQELAGQGIDTVKASVTYTLTANVENLTLLGSSALNGTGNTLNNVLTGNAGINVLTGGAGDDTYVVQNAGDTVVESALNGHDVINSSVSYTLSAEVEDLTLTGTGAINGTGNSGDNLITGNAGLNTLNGGAGNDTLLGGDGNDRFLLSSGNDVISGGPGNDTIVVDEGFGTVEIRDTLGIEFIDFSLIDGPITVDLTPGSVNTVGGGTLAIFEGGAVSEPLDLVFLQDLSGSFGDDIAMVRGLVPDITSAVQVYQPDSYFGVTSHVDKAYGSFGSGEDYVYRTDLQLTSDTTQLQAVYDGLSILSGNDTPESQIEALMQIALRRTEVGWRGNALKVVVLMTDADYHVAGDASALPPNDGDSILDGTPPGTGEDYPSVVMLRQKLVAADILPIFAVTSDVVDEYQELVGLLGFGEVVSLSSDSADIVEAIQTGLNKATAAKIDRILGTAFGDSITGSQYDNVIDGAGGADTMIGGAGDDYYYVKQAGDVVTEAANAGDDTVESTLSYTLTANVENLTLAGGALNGTGNGLANLLLGNAGNNRLTGGGGDDVLDGKAGNDTLIGGTGNDTYIYAAGDVVQESSGAGSDTIATGVSFTLSIANVENVMLTGTGDINATGNGGANVLTGNSGNNVLNGMVGIDAASYANAGAGVTVSLAIAVAQNTVGAGADTLQNIENLTGSSFDDSLTGNAGNNVLDGGIGDDTLTGGAGNDIYFVDASYETVNENAAEGTDTVKYSEASGYGYYLPNNVENLILLGSANSSANGNALANQITGNSGDNYIYGGGGNDTVDGGGGSDSLSGDAGNDRLVYRAGTSYIDGGDGTDRVAVQGSGQTLDFTGFTTYFYGLEEADLTGTGNNTLRTSAQDVLDLSSTADSLKVFGNAGDVVNLVGPGWSASGGPVSGFQTYANGLATAILDTDITVNLNVA